MVCLGREVIVISLRLRLVGLIGGWSNGLDVFLLEVDDGFLLGCFLW
ncbi:hypothetical protein [Candidatus Hodgkinia cicadicola]